MLPAAASKLVLSGLLTTAKVGTTYSCMVTALDGFNNIATGYRGTITFSSTDPDAILPPNYTFTDTAGGVIAFPYSVQMATPGSQTITVADTLISTIRATKSLRVTNPTVAWDPTSRIAQLQTVILPQYQALAQQYQAAIAPYSGSSNPWVDESVEGVQLAIKAINSVPTIISQQPSYLQYHVQDGDFVKWAARMQYFLACAQAGTDPFPTTGPGTVVQTVRAVLSPLDGYLQPYQITFPSNYNPAVPTPLDIVLHEATGDLWLESAVDGAPSTNPNNAASGPAIVVAPTGRGQNSYALGLGTESVLEVLADVEAHYNIDVSRITLGGVSMGGTGGFQLGTLYPGLFSAVWSLTGGEYYGLPQNDPRYDARMRLTNLMDTALVIWDAPHDVHYLTNHASALLLQELTAQYPTYYPMMELTDPNGGHGLIAPALQQQGWSFMRAQQLNPVPDHVHYVSVSERTPGAFWAFIDTRADSSQPGVIDAQLAGDDITVQVTNTERFHLDIPTPHTAATDPVSIIVNGVPVATAQAGQTLYFSASDGGWLASTSGYAPGLVKTLGVSGPINDIFAAPVPDLFVYGTLQTSDSTAAAQTVDGVLTHLLGPADGGTFQYGSFQRTADTAVTAADIANCNLVLVGSPSTNALLAQIAPDLAVSWQAGGIQVGSHWYANTAAGPVALTMIFPNPLNPSRYILILPDNYTGGSPLTYGDYAIHRVVATAQGPAMSLVATGYFSSHWTAS